MTQQDIFTAAVQITDPDARSAYLARACGDDPDLRRRVEILLQTHESAGDFLARPAFEQLAAAPSPPPGTPEDVPQPDQAAGDEALDFMQPPGRPGALGRLGHYEVLEVLGRGGFSIVVRAFDEVLQRVVAIKIMAPQLAATSPARRRFLREARAAAAVRHDNVVGIYAVEEQPIPYLVMEYIAGETLQQRLDRIGPLDVPEVLRIGVQVARGLAAAHARGLIHRDIKPSNILLETGVGSAVKITDFGLARAADDASLTQSGYVAGTPLYMAPEQARGETVGQQADLFSLGSVLYVMCSGRPPFRASTTLAVLKRVAEDTPRPIPEIIPEVPDWLCALIARLHAKQPAERVQSAAEVAGLLGRHLAQLQQTGGEPPEPRAPLSEPRQQRSGGSAPPGKAASSARILAAGAALLALGIVAACWIAWRPDGAEDATHGTAPEARPSEPRPLPAPEELARRPAPADALRREDIRAELLQMAGGGDKDHAPPELVAVFGENRHAAGDNRNQLNAVVISPDGKTLAFGGIDTAVRLVSLEGKPGREKVWNQDAPEGNVESLAFSPDGKVLACAKANGSIRLWDVAARAERRPLASPDSRVVCLAFSPDGTLLASAGDNGGAVVRLWKVATGELLFSSPLPGFSMAWCVAFSPDGKTLAAGLERGEVRLWDVPTQGLVGRLAGPAGEVRWLGFHPDGRSLAVAGGLAENVVCIWDLETRKPRHSLSGHGSGVLSGAWRADGRLLITAGNLDGTVRLWDPRGDQPRSRVLPVIQPNVPWLHGIALSPEGRHLAVCNPNGTVYVLRLAKRGEVFEVPADGG